jgi:Phage integrase family
MGDAELAPDHLPRVPPHTFAALMIAAGVNAKALQTYTGHANISITLDRYGHLMPGSEAEAAGLLGAYLAAELDRSAEQVRGATGERSGEQLANDHSEALA